MLVELDGLDEVLHLDAGLAAAPPPGVEEVVPAARTLLVRFDPERIPRERVRAWLTEAVPAASVPRGERDVEVEIAYDGPDLDRTARLLGVSADELAGRHAAARWRVAFTGFAPGFAYLVSDDWPWQVPRLETPRTRVPAGSVALAAGFTGAYPRATPGGWRLIGRTAAPLFDPAAADPVLLVPGASVRFRPVPGPTVQIAPLRSAADAPRGDAGATPGAAPARAAGGAPAALTVERAGAASVQDLGRPGAARLGIARSGALDRGALRLANRLVGNAPHAAVIEIALGGFVAVASRPLWVAATGAWAPMRIAGRPVDPYAAHAWRSGERLEVGWIDHGARLTVAVRGGVAAGAVLGSRATDSLAALGPPPLRAGDVLAVGAETAGPVPALDVAPWGWPPEVVEVDIEPGPRADWFTPAAHRTLVGGVWRARVDSDRVGMRLEGPPLERARAGELPSEGMVPGALQVPPDGRPAILLADGPVTGGYPVIAVVADASLDRLAQAAAGTRIRFRRA